jgi:hypothetical protein
VTDDYQKDRMVTLTETHFYQLQQDAAEQGADRALAKLGLENGEAREDLDDLRSLLRTLKTMRSEAMKQVVRFITLAILMGLAGVLAMKAKIGL